MRTFVITELTVSDGKAVHYIYCNKCIRVSPFAVKTDDAIIVFMGEVLSIKEELRKSCNNCDNYYWPKCSGADIPEDCENFKPKGVVSDEYNKSINEENSGSI